MLILRNLDPKDLAKLLVGAAETYAGQKSVKAGGQQSLSTAAEACGHSWLPQADPGCPRYE